jgi:abortive infection bacteriophage resistance protein
MTLQQDIPLWAYVDLFTISNISFLYSISDQSIKDAIARTFSLTMKNVLPFLEVTL